jgi:hypothetical protein
MKYFSCISIILIGFTLTSSNSFAKLNVAPTTEVPNKYICASSKEYLTIIRYFDSHKDLLQTSAQAKEIADEISKGCNGAADRFVRVFETLTKVELSGNTSRNVGVLLSNKPDKMVDNFLTIFRVAYVESELNLTASKALEIARKLSFDFPGHFEIAKSSFLKLLGFCKTENLNISLPQCSEFMADVVLESAPVGVDVFATFTESFRYIRNHKDLKISVPKILLHSKTIASYGPRALENFTEFFEFATSEKGLGERNDKALEKALEIARRTEDRRPPQAPPVATQSQSAISEGADQSKAKEN